jgi:hypothetical protein
MKSLFVGLAIMGLAMSVNASGARDVTMSKHMSAAPAPIPMCPPGEHAEFIDGHWECVS